MNCIHGFEKDVEPPVEGMHRCSCWVVSYLNVYVSKTTHGQYAKESSYGHRLIYIVKWQFWRLSKFWESSIYHSRTSFPVWRGCH